MTTPLERLSLAFGWIAFALWTFSFWPQVLMNFQRKSVQGLSIDFVVLNILGFTCYLVANCCLRLSPVVREEYSARHDRGTPSVQWSDIAFGAHALLVTVLTYGQTRYYKRDVGQRLSLVNRGVITLLLATILTTVVIACVSENTPAPTGGPKDVEFLDLVLVVSTIKIYISFAKYVPQAWVNFRRKSTTGWSILNILCDFGGGVLNLSQMFIDAATADDWGSLTSNPGKLGISTLSIVFDLVFMFQHYVLYRHSKSGLLFERRVTGEADESTKADLENRPAKQEDSGAAT